MFCFVWSNDCARLLLVRCPLAVILKHELPRPGLIKVRLRQENLFLEVGIRQARRDVVQWRMVAENLGEARVTMMTMMMLLKMPMMMVEKRVCSQPT